MAGDDTTYTAGSAPLRRHIPGYAQTPAEDDRPSPAATSDAEVEVFGRTYPACRPARLAHADVHLGASALDACQAADEALRGGALAHATGEILLEALASAQIEGIRAEVADVLSPRSAASREGQLVAAALDIARQAAGGVGADDPQVWCDWQKRLVRADPRLRRDQRGALRSVAAWIGGWTPASAVHVPPPPNLIPAALDDLVSFCRRDDMHPIVQAAAAHAQFETVHPFADGNGRTGRAMFTALLARTYGPGFAGTSATLGWQRREYYTALNASRDGNFDPIVELYANSIIDQVELNKRSAIIGREALGDAGGPVGSVLASHGACTIPEAAALAGVSEATARNALRKLEAAGLCSTAPIRRPCTFLRTGFDRQTRHLLRW